MKNVGREEKEIFAAYLAKNRLKRSEQREAIVDTFLRSQSHLSVDDLLHLVQKRRADVGRTTVYRTLKLLQAAGLAQELELRGESRFEREHNRAHHDHFICQHCGDIIEFESPEIERIQDEIASGLGFEIEGHRHQIFGRCRACAARPPRAEARR
ncbi:MAG TPA: transcriptional repressor [Vicinamibacteria bacterium]|nr:transcriptional repressor [Vicinamibacteria bacterium]